MRAIEPTILNFSIIGTTIGLSCSLRDRILALLPSNRLLSHNDKQQSLNKNKQKDHRRSSSRRKCFRVIFVIDFYRMQQLSSEGLHLQQIETTAILNKAVNVNCAFDGSNIVYVSGSSLVFHNVFQNNKQFVPRASDFEVTAIAFHKAADVSTVLITRSLNSRQDMLHVEFYFYGKKPIIIDIGEDLVVNDAVFLEKKKVLLLCHSLSTKTSTLLLVNSHKKIRKIELPEKAHKLIANQRKVLILADCGCLEFNIESESMNKMKKYTQYSLRDILLLDSEAELLFDRQNYMHSYADGKLVQSVPLGRADMRHSQNNQTEAIQTEGQREYQTSVRLGRNILVAYRNELLLSYFQVEEGHVEMMGSFEYCEKLRANILTMQSSMDEMNLVLAVQVFHKEQFRMEHFLFNLSVLSQEKKFINPFYRMVANGAEVGEVSSLQKIVPSEVYYLVGPNIVNYSYVENIEKKHKYAIHESPKLVIVHPLGHQILCIFQTFFKFYQKIELQLIETWTEQLLCSAARYTDSGLLLLCIYEDNAHQIVTYNPNNFRRMRTYAGIYLKHAVVRIDIDDTEQELILYSQKDLFVHKFKTGEKVSEFREKKENVEANCVEYDHNRKLLLVGGKKCLIVCRKIEDYCLNFTSQKTIRLEQDITCVYIRENIQTLFLGTADGRILHCPYPLNMNEQIEEDVKIYKVEFSCFKLHYLPVIDMLLTNNSKFLFVSIRGDGLSILKLKRTAALTGKNSYNPFDISNYNFIQTSSKPYLDTVHEKLKGLLEKRKTIFNQLDEFKKQWENKRMAETKVITTLNKKKELVSINATLGDINRAKLQHQALLEELARFETTAKQAATDHELNHHKQLLLCYQSNDELKATRETIQNRCKQQHSQIMTQCATNLSEIKEELEGKFKQFESNYHLMRQNLVKFGLRRGIEDQEDRMLQSEEVSEIKLKLKREEEQLYKRNNQLKGDITKNKKELERYLNRKDFLQNKRRFFVEELKYCANEQQELLQIKQTLEQELADLESVTHKKQKRLRKYFIQNEILIKYQLIHDNLIKQSNKETEFIEAQHQNLKKNINALQLEILSVSEQREVHSKQLARRQKELAALKEFNKQLTQKYEFLQLQILELQNEISKTNEGKLIDEQSKNGQYMNIYTRYFVGKRLQHFISSEKVKEDELATVQHKRNQQKIKQVLHDHKDYLVKNMNLFEKYNTRIIDQINLTYLKYQTQNYNLISECNIRKEQIHKKKRILHQLVDSVRETSNYMAQLQKEPPVSSHAPIMAIREQIPKQIPFVVYEKKQEEERMDLRKEKSESTLWKMKKSTYQVRKMLEVQKVKGIPVQRSANISRRIQTATLKKKPMDSSHEQVLADQSIDAINPLNYFIDEPKKPQTAAAHRSRRHKENNEAKRLFSRTKCSSKPTTCTSHSKSKYSVFG